MTLAVKPWTIKAALPWVKETHRHLPRVQGGRWAVRLERDGVIVGCAIVGHGARALGLDTLTVTRVAVIDGVPNGCSMLYGACSKAARAMGADDLITYTLADEPGTTLRAAGWVCGGETAGGDWGRPSRARASAVQPGRKTRWLAPWGVRARRYTPQRSA